MFHIVHIATTCLLGLLFIETYHELKKVKTDIAQEKAKLKPEKSYVTQSYFEDTVNNGVKQKMESTAKQAGQFFVTGGELWATREEMQEHYRELVALEKRVKILEEK